MLRPTRNSKQVRSYFVHQCSKMRVLVKMAKCSTVHLAFTYHVGRYRRPLPVPTARMRNSDLYIHPYHQRTAHSARGLTSSYGIGSGITYPALSIHPLLVVPFSNLDRLPLQVSRAYIFCGHFQVLFNLIVTLAGFASHFVVYLCSLPKSSLISIHNT